MTLSKFRNIHIFPFFGGPELSENAPSGMNPEEMPTSSLSTQGVPRLQLMDSSGKGRKPGRLQVNRAMAPSSTLSKWVCPSSGCPGSTQTGPAKNKRNGPQNKKDLRIGGRPNPRCRPHCSGPFGRRRRTCPRGNRGHGTEGLNILQFKFIWAPGINTRCPL